MIKMSSNLHEIIINDLKEDFPKIESITENEKEIIIRADDDTLWEIYETLYMGIENLELNLEKDEKSYITIII